MWKYLNLLNNELKDYGQPVIQILIKTDYFLIFIFSFFVAHIQKLIKLAKR